MAKKTTFEKKLMIGGQALVKLGSSRHTLDVDYLIKDLNSKYPFSHDKLTDTDYCNANGSQFFADVWQMEIKNNGEIASPQALLELKAFAYAQHCLNGFFKKADDAEFDIKFLVREFNLKALKIAKKYISKTELVAINNIIKAVKK